MSAFTDAQRKEAAFEARVARAKAQMLLDQSVLRAEVEGLSQRETAELLDIDREQLASIRRHLHLATAVWRRRQMREGAHAP